MTKTVLNDLVNLENQTSSVSTVNTNNAVIETAFDNTLSRDGTNPNQMEASLDMNSNRILNLPEPISQLEPIRLVDLDDLELGNVSFSSLPVAGTKGQVLTKNSTTNYDVSWLTSQSGPTPQDFGATGNGITDDTVALNAFFQVLGNNTGIGGINGYIPAGTYLYTSTLNIPSRNDWVLEGAGKYTTILKYVGASQTIDLMVVGNGTDPVSRFSINNLQLNSTTTMTAGTALHFKNCNFFTLNNVALARQGSNVFYNGVWLDSFTWCAMTNVSFFASNDITRFNTGGPIYIDNIEMLDSSTAIGLHFAGGSGGLSLGEAEIDRLSIGMVVDTAIDASGNSQFFVSNLAKFDSNINAGIFLNDAVPSSKSLSFNGWVSSTSAGSGLDIINFAQGNIQIGGGAQFLSNNQNGIVYSDASVNLAIDPSVAMSANGAFGLNATVSTDKILSDAKGILTNISGDYSANSHVEGTGYRKHANGYIHQWGTVTGNAAADTAVTFPIPFTTSVNSLTGSVKIVATSGATISSSVNFGSISNAGFTGFPRVIVGTAGPARSAEDWYWEAWGK